MQKLDSQILYSASDLASHLACQHCTYLDLLNLEAALTRADEDEHTHLIQEKGLEHERRYLQRLRDDGHDVVEIPTSDPTPSRVEQTRSAIADGAEHIYQAALVRFPWYGYADFLRRVSMPGETGHPRYEVVDTKLARTPAPRHVLQLCLYSDLLATEQGFTPHSMHLVLGDGREVSLRVADFRHYYALIRRRFEAFCATPPTASSAEPCQHCDLCHWRKRCSDQWERDDHLSLVAHIQRSQTRRLENAGVPTVRSLAELPDDRSVGGISGTTLSRLRHQARLQIAKRDTGRDRVDLLPGADGRGFARLPRPDSGDLFFDIEGDPLYPDGLEYLFGVYGLDGDGPWFRPFWGHDHDAERRSFEGLMDFLSAHLSAHPAAHIYHYAGYEESAIKRLASRYGTREHVVDNLLRQQRLVDLYRVVREAVRVSEPSYSLKNIEAFYMPARTGDVRTGTESIVIYERWRSTSDDALLREIASYNELDCRSTMLLRDWLLKLRPADAPWRAGADVSLDGAATEQQAETDDLYEDYGRRLLSACPRGERSDRELIGHLLGFHRREAKPQWWAMFDRRERTEDELVDDAECLGALRRDHDLPVVPQQRSLEIPFRFPPQDYKFAPGDDCLRADTLGPAGTITDIDLDACVVRIRRANKRDPLPDALSLIPKGPIQTSSQEAAIRRFADAMIADDGRYGGVRDLVARVRPRIAGLPAGAPIVEPGGDLQTATAAAVSRLRDSYLFIQGPPGAGKTFTSANVIVELIRADRRVGVTSNSHKAIIRLLQEVEAHAGTLGVRFRGIKKSTANRPESFFHGQLVEDVTANEEVDPTADLIAGTAWLFSRPELDQALDYLFIDEAGQVSLADAVAMGVSARNIVLVGDQMQLGQPIQGVHPGDSGQSVLEHLLREQATIPPDRGIFLPTTWRMHERICRFISEAVYDGRLEPEPENQRQRLVLADDCHPALAPTGIRFVPVEHSGCSQKSEAEAALITALVGSLVGQGYRDRQGLEHTIGLKDVLVVAPYNVQVNYLRSVLPPDARVGTVDKFQGQQAEVVLISMTTSSGEELPRNIEFLYSRNRLNVAISRARCLAVVLASPKLLEIQCRTVEQMKLVNTLCWVREYADAAFE